MKFRCKMTDIICIQYFTKIVSSISKLAKTCVLRITPSNMYFASSDKLVTGGVTIWSEVVLDHLFTDYNMEGLSEEYNEIYLELSPENVLRVLRSAQNAKSVKIKLAKKLAPCLTFDIELPSLLAKARVVVHDVPVNVVSRRFWDEYKEPEMPNFDISSYLPSLKVLKNVVDKMKNLSTYVSISVSVDGEMSLKVESEMVTVVTTFRNLEILQLRNDDESSQQISRHSAEVRIDIRKLSNFLSGQQVNPTNVICNILHGRQVQFLLLHDDVKIQYLISCIEP